MGHGRQVEVQAARMNRREVFRQRAGTDGRPGSLEVGCQTRRYECGRVGRSGRDVSCAVHQCDCYLDDILLNTWQAGGEHVGELLDEVWPISRLLQLLDGLNNNFIVDSLDVDLVVSFGGGRWRRRQLCRAFRLLILDADAGCLFWWAHETGGR